MKNENDFETIMLEPFVNWLDELDILKGILLVDHAQNVEKILRDKMGVSKNFHEHEHDDYDDVVPFKQLNSRASKNTQEKLLRLASSVSKLHIKALVKQLKNNPFLKVEIFTTLDILSGTLHRLPVQPLIQIFIRETQKSIIKKIIVTENELLHITPFQRNETLDHIGHCSNFTENGEDLLNSSTNKNLKYGSIILPRFVLSDQKYFEDISSFDVSSFFSSLRERQSCHPEGTIILQLICFPPNTASLFCLHEATACFKAYFIQNTLELVEGMIKISDNVNRRLLETLALKSMKEGEHHKMRRNFHTIFSSGRRCHLCQEYFKNIHENMDQTIFRLCHLFTKIRTELKRKEDLIGGFFCTIKQKPRYVGDLNKILSQSGFYGCEIPSANLDKFLRKQEALMSRARDSKIKFQVSSSMLPQKKHLLRTLRHLSVKLSKCSLRFHMKNQSSRLTKLKPQNLSSFHQSPNHSSSAPSKPKICQETPKKLSLKSRQVFFTLKFPQKYLVQKFHQTINTNRPMTTVKKKMRFDISMRPSFSEIYPISDLWLQLKYSRFLVRILLFYLFRYSYDHFEKDHFLVRLSQLKNEKFRLFGKIYTSSVSFELYKPRHLKLFLHSHLSPSKEIFHSSRKILEQQQIVNTSEQASEISKNCYLVPVMKKLHHGCSINSFPSQDSAHCPQGTLINISKDGSLLEEKRAAHDFKLAYKEVKKTPGSILKNKIITPSLEEVRSIKNLLNMSMHTSTISSINSAPSPSITSRPDHPNRIFSFPENDSGFLESELPRCSIDSDIKRRLLLSSINDRWNGLIKKSSFGEGMWGIFMNSEPSKSSSLRNKSVGGFAESISTSFRKHEPKSGDWICGRKISLINEEIDKQQIAVEGFEEINGERINFPVVKEGHESSTGSYKFLNRTRFKSYHSQSPKAPHSSQKVENDDYTEEDEKGLKNAISIKRKTVSGIKLDELTWDDLKKKLSYQEYEAVRQKMLIFKTPALRETRPLHDISEDERDAILARRRKEFLEYGRIPFSIRQDMEKPCNFHRPSSQSHILEDSRLSAENTCRGFGNFYKRNFGDRRKSSLEFECPDTKPSQRTNRPKLNKTKNIQSLKKELEENQTGLACQDNVEQMGVPRILRLITNSACSLRSKAKTFVSMSPASSNDAFTPSLGSKKFFRPKFESPSAPSHISSAHRMDNLPSTPRVSEYLSSQENNRRLNYVDEVWGTCKSSIRMQDFDTPRKINESKYKSTWSLRSLFMSHGQKVREQCGSEEPCGFDRKIKLTKFKFRSHEKLPSRAIDIEQIRPIRNDTHTTSEQKTQSDSSISSSTSEVSPVSVNRIPTQEASRSTDLRGRPTKTLIPQPVQDRIKLSTLELRFQGCHDMIVNDPLSHQTSKLSLKKRLTRTGYLGTAKFHSKADSVQRSNNQVLCEIKYNDDTWITPPLSQSPPILPSLSPCPSPILNLTNIHPLFSCEES